MYSLVISTSLSYIPKFDDAYVHHMLPLTEAHITPKGMKPTMASVVLGVVPINHIAMKLSNWFVCKLAGVKIKQ